MLAKPMKTKRVHAHISIVAHERDRYFYEICLGEWREKVGDVTGRLRTRRSREKNRMERDATVTKRTQNLVFARGLTAKKSFHQQGEMLSWNSAGLCSFRDHTAILGQFRLKIGFREVLYRTFLGFHVGK